MNAFFPSVDMRNELKYLNLQNNPQIGQLHINGIIPSRLLEVFSFERGQQYE
ncbi:MAG: hypothetical protein WBF33_28730 [Candidatus Nitrosopolaris sp.]|jgi:hypothetical protein